MKHIQHEPGSMPNTADQVENGVLNLDTNQEDEEHIIRHHDPMEVIAAAVANAEPRVPRELSGK